MRILRQSPLSFAVAIVLYVVFQASPAPAQEKTGTVELAELPNPDPTKPPVVITLADAIEQARKVDARFQGALTDAKLAREDGTQARNALLPAVSYTTQALLTQGNGGRTTIGRFVTNDGVHVYRSWGVVHEDLSPGNYLGTTYRSAKATAAIASAKAEIAKRGLTVTVTKLYYGLAVAQRKYASAQSAAEGGRHFYQITRDQENAGQVAHSDALQAEIQYRQQEQIFEDAKLQMESARLDLAVLLFPTLSENFSIVDDMDSAVALPSFAEAQRMAANKNPDLRAAMEALHQANLGLVAARGAFLPTFVVDADYGIEANAFALHSTNAEETRAGVLPNLGYFITVGVNVPVWDWGTLRSKLHQAGFKREQAKAEMSQTQREMLNALYSSYNEATVARAAVDETRRTADLAAASLRLTDLRYKAGTSTGLDVVVAENTLSQARNAFSDAQVRYRVAVATLQSVTGSF